MLKLRSVQLRSVYLTLKNQGFSALLKRIKMRLTQAAPATNIELRPPRKPNAGGVLSFTRVVEPLVSIIIPVHNQFHYTCNCLSSILEATQGVQYEVIVVDDASDDETKNLDRYVEGLNLIRKETNSGFIESCNRGALAANGEYLVFLNNDTIVQVQWLEMLISTFRSDDSAGLVAAKLIYPDGRLQEAGGIVWADGSAWNYGRFDDPDKPQYNYVREIDYGSGACIAIPKQLFIELAMFDVRYKPAYYEDTDLAFSVRSVGKRVLYQPKARIIHYEGITSGTDANLGAKKYQTLNKEKFAEKWATALAGHYPPYSNPEIAKDRNAKNRILVLDMYTPMPDKDSGSLRMFNILQILSRLSNKVTFIAGNIGYSGAYTDVLQSLGIETPCAPYIDSIDKYLKEWGSTFDVVIVSRLELAKKYISNIRRLCPQAKVIFDTVDLHYLRESREAALRKDRNTGFRAAQRKNEELSIARMADITLVVSPVEQEILAKEAPDIDVEIVSNIHFPQPTEAGFEERSGIIFIANFNHSPNLDAILYYAEKIHPLVRSMLGDVQVTIIGDDPPRRLKEFSTDGIVCTGYVEDIMPYFNRCRLSIAPMRYGAGVKGKINSSMSFGVPVVTTSIGAEGMNLTDGEDILIADTPEFFAELITRLYSDDQLWKKISTNGVENIKLYFSSQQAETILSRIIHE